MMKRTLFTDEHQVFRRSVRRFAESEIAPYHEAWEEEGCVPRALWTAAGEIGLLCPDAPEAYGGAGVDYRYNVVVDEELARIGANGPGFMLHSDIVLPYIAHHGTDAQRARWIPKMVSGEVVTAIAMSEPGAGSDLQGIATTAVKDGTDYVLNGSKTFITNGQLADLVIVVAKTDPAAGAHGTSLFLVEADRPGFTRGRNLKKVGLNAQDTSELFFEDLRVPASNLLGSENAGFMHLMQELPQERLAVAVVAVAAAETVLEWTIRYVKEREAFGRPIGKFQNTRFVVAGAKAQVEAGRAYVDRCIESHLQGALTIPDAAAVKLWASEMQWEVTDACVQLFGGYGYMLEYPIARAWRDARIQRVWAGTSEIMKEIVARSLLS